MYNFTDRWFARVRSDSNENLNDWPVRTRYMPFISEPDWEHMCGSHTVPTDWASAKEQQRIQERKNYNKNRARIAKERTDAQIADFNARQIFQTEFEDDY